MVANVPIEMLTSSTRAEPYSPIIWDGSDLVVVAESALNLRKIRSDISSLASKQQGYYNDIKNVETQVSGISIELAKVAERYVHLRPDGEPAAELAGVLRGVRILVRI